MLTGGAAMTRRLTRDPNGLLTTTLAGVLLVALGVALIPALVELWPAVQSTTTAKPATRASAAVHFLFGAFTVHVTADTSLLVLVIVAAAIGAYIHAATSFADFVGNKRFVASWTWWYLLRLFIGVSLALLLYFAVRGGFLSASSTSTDVNPYGIATLAGLAGLFSKQATDKLREVFETMFRVRQDGGDAQRDDDLALPQPHITATDPSRGTAGEPLTLTVLGTGFNASTSLKVGDVAVHTTFDNTQRRLTATVPAILVASDAVYLTAVNPPPGGGASHTFVLPIVPAAAGT
jgi:hypothetical protein